MALPVGELLHRRIVFAVKGESKVLSLGSYYYIVKSDEKVVLIPILLLL
ncbi:MAG: hypothetical protein PHI06_05485 [Desulfobulbaceae bacterium]|nr:hypothetical protein [Desulfobulbaceae bacterium]